MSTLSKPITLRIAACQQWQPSRRHTLFTTTAPALSAFSAGIIHQKHAYASTTSASPSSSMPTTEIMPGLTVSRVIKGCWQLSGGHVGNSNTDRTRGPPAVEDFKSFVDAGITTFDTADIYGPSEKIIGEFLASTDQNTRAKTQIFTKFCCFGSSMQQARDASYVEKCIDKSRANLGVDTLDCVQFYWHDYSVQGYVDAALHLAELQSKGKIKAIGVTNFDTFHLNEMMDAGVPIVENQIQYSLLDSRPENGQLQYCIDKGIKIIPYGTAAGGFLTNTYYQVDSKGVNINTYSLSKYASVINQRGGWDWLQQLLTVLSYIAEKHGVSIAEVSSRWVLDRPGVAAVIIGARNARHVEQHRKIFSFEFDQEDIEKIQAVLETGRRPKSDVYSWERGGSWRRKHGSVVPKALNISEAALTVVTDSPVRDALAAGFSIIGAKLLVGIFESLEENGVVDKKLSRKLVHTLAGPLFLFCWPLFSSEPYAQYLAAVVPSLNGLRLLLAGTETVKDPRAVAAMTRTGDPKELLRGPLYYVIVLFTVTALFWRNSPVGLIVTSFMCGGDGMADIIGRRYGSNNPLPWNPEKSWAGTSAMFAGGYAMSLALLAYFNAFGYFSIDMSTSSKALFIIAVVASLIESLPINKVLDDNLSVPGVAAVLGMVVFAL